MWQSASVRLRALEEDRELTALPGGREMKPVRHGDEKMTETNHFEHS